VPVKTPFHSRTSQYCTSLLWKQWAGYHAVRSYDTCHEREYFALRHAAGLIDVTALYKYEVIGKDAAAFLSRVMVKDINRLGVGRVTYLCWCDDDGKVLDDGTVTRISEDHFRVTAAEASFAWLCRNSRGFSVTIEDSSEQLGALALQGPTSRDILVASGAVEATDLRYFRHTTSRIGDVDVHITRTGYTGDLGYEVWVPNADAVVVYEALMAAGKPHRIQPAGLDAMDVTRVEAGFIMNGVDYYSANHCFLESRKSTPYELGLGWSVDLERDPFVGQLALQAEKQRGSDWATVGLVYNWDEYEALFAEVALPPAVSGVAWREPVPIYDAMGGRQIGYATSGAWSPTLKKLLALATVESAYKPLGSRVRIEVTVEFARKTVGAEVSAMPFFNPPRKRAR
jgi:aminomethyltransferase